MNSGAHLPLLEFRISCTKKRMKKFVRLMAGLSALLLPAQADALDSFDATLQAPKVGQHTLRILSPTVLELVLVSTKEPDPAPAETWNWVNGGAFTATNFSAAKVIVNGQTNPIVGVGFKRRPLFAPLDYWDLRIGTSLYLQVSNAIAVSNSVQVINDGTLWATNLQFTSMSDPLRYNSAIHVNHEGYVPLFPKSASVGYYLGNMGELPITATNFFLVDMESGSNVFQGTLVVRSDVGFDYTPTPYQEVRDADFSSFTTPGEYRVMVPGMGASLPFRIDEGVAMNFARTYALGLFHQRSGYNVDMPFTRFTHGADHIAPAVVPVTNTPPFTFTWATLASYANQTNSDNPPQIAPWLTNVSSQLYPFVNPGPVDVAGGHFEAANYSKVAWNMAQTVHVLMYAVDALPGVGALDNLGIPESGDGISDVLQEAKWEADALAKMQDADGGFYYMVHPVEREYEYDVLPENGDPQVVWPKNTASTAAAVAALVQCASSPRFKEAYPQVASNYWAKAMLGWKFLTNAIATHGQAGAYQKMMHFDDAFTHVDDLAWAACELFLATGDAQYHTRLQNLFPDPTDPSATRWGWWKMHACYGNVIRNYSAAVKSGRLETNQLDPAYYSKCTNALTDCGNDHLRWSQENAYGSSLPDVTKRVRTAGWYYSTEQAFDIVVAQQFNPKPEYVDAILRNINYETGCNPVNVSYVTGLGWKRQRFIVDQYSANDRRVLPKIGVPISNMQEGFLWNWTYGSELGDLCFPHDGLESGPYPFYDRWADFWNVYTEASTVNTVRNFAVTLWLAAQTSLTNQAWRSTNAVISTSANAKPVGQPVTVMLEVADTNLSGARIVWEARDQEPAFGGLDYTFTPMLNEGAHWVEAEVQWPDGRRAFATNVVMVTASTIVTNAPALLSEPQMLEGTGFSFLLTGTANATYVIEASTNLMVWEAMATNTVASNGEGWVTNHVGGGFHARYFRAMAEQ
jgi:hypothetical protein